MQPLQSGATYHIYNHANGFEGIFRTDENFEFFLRKYRQHISPIAETYAYCLMPNHFHLVVRIRRREIIEKLAATSSNFSSSNFSKVWNFRKVDKAKIIELFLSKQFSNFFSSYTQAFNRMYSRKGSLFIKNFKRSLIDSKAYFLNTIIYTHRNPVHHGFCSHFSEWKWSSYNEIINYNLTSSKSNFSKVWNFGKVDKADNEVTGDEIVESFKILQMFGEKENFLESHENKLFDFKLDDTD